MGEEWTNVMEVCPHCGLKYNKGAAVCFNCGRFVSVVSWLRMEWPVVVVYAVVVGAAVVYGSIVLGYW